MEKKKNGHNPEIDNNEMKIIKQEIVNKVREIKFTGKILGKNGSHQIHDIILSGSIPGAGLILKFPENNNSDNLEKKIKDYLMIIKGKNVIKQHAIFEIKRDSYKICLVVMEKANLSDLQKLINYVSNKNLLKTIITPFINITENVLRYLVLQMVHGLEEIRRYGFVHFNIKTQNFLVTYNIGIKISDYSRMKRIKENDEKMTIPEGSDGFMPPEYYFGIKMDYKLLYSVDIFSLGACIYNLITGKLFFNINKNLSNQQKIHQIKFQYERNIKIINGLIYSGFSEDLIELLKKMLKYNPEDRIKFEYIYRNEWINKDSKEINKIVDYYEADEEKIIMELQKSNISLQIEKENEENNNRYKKYQVPKKVKKYIRKKDNINYKVVVNHG